MLKSIQLVLFQQELGKRLGDNESKGCTEASSWRKAGHYANRRANISQYPAAQCEDNILVMKLHFLRSTFIVLYFEVARAIMKIVWPQ